MNKFYTIIVLFLFLNLFINCKNDLNNFDAYSNIEGTWEKDNIYLNFSSELWRCLIAMDNVPPFFYGDEPYAFPDGFNSYDEYINSGKYNPFYCFEGNSGYFKIIPNYLTLYENNTKYTIRYEINNNIMKLQINNNKFLNIFYDNTIYRPFNPTIRSNNDNSENIYFDLNGTWIKSE
jgi:hypothetical protein